jgi:hypothetical protein
MPMTSDKEAPRRTTIIIECAGQCSRLPMYRANSDGFSARSAHRASWKRCRTGPARQAHGAARERGMRDPAYGPTEQRTRLPGRQANHVQMRDRCASRTATSSFEPSSRTHDCDKFLSPIIPSPYKSTRVSENTHDETPSHPKISVTRHADHPACRSATPFWRFRPFSKCRQLQPP